MFAAGRAFTRGLQLQKQNIIGVSCTSSVGFTKEDHSNGEQAFISTWVHFQVVISHVLVVFRS